LREFRQDSIEEAAKYGGAEGIHSILNKADMPSAKDTAEGPIQISTAIARKVIECLVSAFFLNTAKQSRGKDMYDTLVDRRNVVLHPSCVLMSRKRAADPSNGMPAWKSKKKSKHGTDSYANGSVDREWVVYHEHVVTSKHYLRTVSAVPDKNIFFKCAPKEWYSNVLDDAGNVKGVAADDTIPGVSPRDERRLNRNSSPSSKSRKGSKSKRK
jgi:Oligonucleotide/oligosaccharide-binding (OB)-fold